MYIMALYLSARFLHYVLVAGLGKEAVVSFEDQQFQRVWRKLRSLEPAKRCPMVTTPNPLDSNSLPMIAHLLECGPLRVSQSEQMILNCLWKFRESHADGYGDLPGSSRWSGILDTLSALSQVARSIHSSIYRIGTKVFHFAHVSRITSYLNNDLYFKYKLRTT